MYYDVGPEMILFDNVLWQRVELDLADIKKRLNSLEAEKVVHLCIKISFNSALFEDEFRVR